MKKSSISILAFGFQLLAFGLSAQNVGIGTTTPSEKLDVNGNMNITGQLKANGTAGTAGQVLTSNGSTMVWGSNGAQYKNMATFDGTLPAYSDGTNNSSYTWTVPAGITSILVEGWGGGGGGGNISSGGGGAYISAQLVVTPGGTVSLTVGAGGQCATDLHNYEGVVGGTTSIQYGINIDLEAFGGTRGNAKHYTDDVDFNFYPPYAPGFRASGTSPGQAIGFYGGPSKVSELVYIQISSTEFAKKVSYADGGDAALMPGSGGRGGYFFVSTTYHQIVQGLDGQQPGGGGGADGGGKTGLGGRVIIHY